MEPADLEIESLLRAFDVSVVQVLSALGPAMLILVKNDQANLRKTREAATNATAALAASAEPEGASDEAASERALRAALRAGSVRALLEDEIGRGLHVPAPQPIHATVADADAAEATANGTSIVERGAKLRDPSAAISLLWLRRSLKFTVVLMGLLRQAKQERDDRQAIDQIVDLGDLGDLDADDGTGGGGSGGGGTDGADDAGKAVKGAYDRVIRPYHSWLLRKTFDIVSSQVPHVDEAVAMLGPGLGDAVRERQVFEEVELYLAEAWPVVELLEGLFAELRLEDLHQV